MPTRNELTQLQSLPLELKVMRTQQRIREWVQYYGADGVYVSFSGGSVYARYAFAIRLGGRPEKDTREIKTEKEIKIFEFLKVCSNLQQFALTCIGD